MKKCRLLYSKFPFSFLEKENNLIAIIQHWQRNFTNPLFILHLQHTEKSSFGQHLLLGGLLDLDAHTLLLPFKVVSAVVQIE